jgi:pyruvate formate lyase activating enzyme
VGCNFRCRFCQNADIAQIAIEGNGPIPGKRITPEAIVAGAKKEGCRSIAYTYNEPTVFFELALATATLARRQNIKNVFVTNGYMSPEGIDILAPVLDAANVDLKAFSDDFYKKMCGAKLAPVKETLKKMRASDIFVEVTSLVIPGLNDDPEELRHLAEFIVNDLGPDTPWHVSRYYPTFRLTDRPPTPVDTLLQARDIGLRAGLRHVYTGNIPGEAGEDTFCFKCGTRLIHRRGYVVGENKIRDGRCPDCGVEISGMGMSS